MMLLFVLSVMTSGLTFGLTFAFGALVPMQTQMQIWTANADDERAYY